MRQKLLALFYNPRTLLVLFVFGALFISVQLILLGTHEFVMPKVIPTDIMNTPERMNQFIGKHMTEYNNYIIFRQSFYHLLHGADLYTIYPNEHWDFYKYSPTFAFFMGTIAWLPDYLGLSIWNLLNCLAIFVAIRMLPFSTKTQCLLLWFIGNELLTSFSNAQSNGLMCGLMVAAYACMQRDKVALATLWLVVATFIKVYGAVGFCLFLFYPGKIRFILYSVLWTGLLFVIPLIVTPLHTLLWQYQNWFALMKADAAAAGTAAAGLSVAGWLNSWFGISNNGVVTIMGFLLFLIPFIRFRLYRDEVYKLLILASMLIWVIIFNHKAESPTFIIAVTGVGIWYFVRPRTLWRTILIWIVLVFTSLSNTDFFPDYVKNHFMKPYKIKTVPCIIVWGVVSMELMLLRGGGYVLKREPGGDCLTINKAAA
jgi:Glycosyltransferase family 87